MRLPRERQPRRQKDALKLEALRRQIEAGVNAIDRGDFFDIDEAELEDYLEQLAASACSSLDPSP